MKTRIYKINESMKKYYEIALEFKKTNDEYNQKLIDLKERLNKVNTDISHLKSMTDEEFYNMRLVDNLID